MNAVIEQTVPDDPPVKLAGGCAKSREPLNTYSTGPRARTRDLGRTELDLAQRYGIQAFEWVPSITVFKTIRLVSVPPRQAASLNPTIEVTLNYRFLDPNSVQLIKDSSNQLLFVNLHTAENAVLTNSPSVQRDYHLVGDTSLRFNVEDSCADIHARIMNTIARTTGLDEEFRAIQRPDLWVWTVFAECSLLSEHVSTTTWPSLKLSIASGGWWFRVYLVEMNPVYGAKGWATRSLF